LARQKELTCTVVIDERSAAFVALGMSIKMGEPVAVVCTSGSAAMNFGPALAEAFYRKTPLIAVTADRPEEWIDQDDSQTIRQAGALAAVVKGSFDIPVCRGEDDGLKRLCRRRIADAVLLAAAPEQGPVHINMQIDEPINAMSEDCGECFCFPERMSSLSALDSRYADDLATEISSAKRVMVVAGFMPPSPALSDMLTRLPGNVAVLCEAQSNLHGPFVNNIDATLNAMSDELKKSLLPPDIVITIGGALLSRMIKAALRPSSGIRHWNIGPVDHCIDPLLHLRKRIECDSITFFKALLPKLKNNACTDYRACWLHASALAKKRSQDFAAQAPWSDFKAMHILLSSMPDGLNLHLSNGTAVRYAQLFDTLTADRVECNRGVSGIDGCTSTAIGAALVSHRPTLLVTGDMSAQYDMGALAISHIPASFRMAVLNNGGGGIFRFIKATCDLPETEQYLAADVRLPLRELAEGFGFDYYEADNAPSLYNVLPLFFAAKKRPAILNIITPAQTSAQTIKKYFNRQS